MYKKLAEKLDVISEVLENKGLVKFAHKLDILANTLEKIAYDVKNDAAYKRMQEAIQILSTPAGDPQINVRKSSAYLNQIKMNMEMKTRSYADVPEIQTSVGAYNQAVGFLTNNNVPEAIKALTISIQNLETAGPIISKKQMAPKITPTS